MFGKSEFSVQVFNRWSFSIPNQISKSFRVIAFSLGIAMTTIYFLQPNSNLVYEANRYYDIIKGKMYEITKTISDRINRGDSDFLKLAIGLTLFGISGVKFKDELKEIGENIKLFFLESSRI